jgi:hypothetical protein
MRVRRPEHVAHPLAGYVTWMTRLWSSHQLNKENELNCHLLFLDIDIYRTPDGSLEHSVYRKFTHTNLYL